MRNRRWGTEDWKQKMGKRAISEPRPIFSVFHATRRWHRFQAFPTPSFISGIRSYFGIREKIGAYERTRPVRYMEKSNVERIFTGVFVVVMITIIIIMLTLSLWARFYHERAQGSISFRGPWSRYSWPNGRQEMQSSSYS